MAKVKNNAVSQNVRHVDDEHVSNKYYLLISDRYMRAKYLAIILLVIFIAFTVFLFREDITYANLMYLIRDFNTSSAAYNADFDPIKYEEQDKMNFGVYRGELAVIGNRTLRMYNSNGQLSRSYEPGYADPALASSDKYILAYDIGGTSYSLYTSIAKVYDGVSDGAMENADLNNSGSHILVCRSDQTKYVVSAFDSSFKNTAKYYKNKYVTSAVIGNDGQVIISSFDSADGNAKCEIELYTDGAETPTSVYTKSGVFPIKCGIWDNGNYYVICTDRVLFFDSDGSLLNTSSSSLGYTSFAEGENKLVVSAENDSVGASSKIIVFDTKGESIYDTTLKGNVSSLAVSDESVYALFDGKATIMPLNNGNILSYEIGDSGSVLVSTGTSAIVCSRDGAEGLVFGLTSGDNEVFTEAVTQNE